MRFSFSHPTKNDCQYSLGLARCPYSKLHCQSQFRSLAKRPLVKVVNANKINLKRDKTQLSIQKIHIVRRNVIVSASYPTNIRFPSSHGPHKGQPGLKTAAYIKSNCSHQHVIKTAHSFLRRAAAGPAFYWKQLTFGENSHVERLCGCVWFGARRKVERVGTEERKGNWGRQNKKHKRGMDAQVLLLMDPGAELGWAVLSDTLPS